MYGRNLINIKTFFIILSLSRIWALKFLKSETTINTILFMRKFVHGYEKLYADSKTIEKKNSKMLTAKL